MKVKLSRQIKVFVQLIKRHYVHTTTAATRTTTTTKTAFSEEITMMTEDIDTSI